MSNRLLERIAAAGGIVGAVMTVAYVVLLPSAGFNASPAEVIKGVNSHREGMLAWNLVGTLSFFLFLFFLGSLYSALRRAEGGTGWLSLLTLGGGVALVAVHSIESVTSYALAWHVARDGNTAVVQALSDISNLVAYYYAVPLSVMLLAASLVAWRTHALPRWIAGVGFVASAVWLIGAIGVIDPQHGPLTAVGFGGGLVLFFLIWLPATSIALMRAPEARDARAMSVPTSPAVANAR